MDDIINTDGKVVNIRDLNNKFKIDVSILNYYTMKTKIELFLSKYRILGNFTLERPSIVLFKSNSGCRNYYNIFNNAEAQNYNPTCEILWTNIVQKENLYITIEERWKLIYKICFYSVRDNNITWFQYRILNGILGTKSYLKKTKNKYQ